MVQETLEVAPSSMFYCCQYQTLQSLLLLCPISIRRCTSTIPWGLQQYKETGPQGTQSYWES